MHVRMYHVGMYACMHVRVSTCVCVRVTVCLCVCVCVSLSLSLSLALYICIRIRTCRYINMCAHSFVDKHASKGSQHPVILFMDDILTPSAPTSASVPHL